MAQTKTKTHKATIVEIGRKYYARTRDKLMFSRGVWWLWSGKVWEPCHDLEQSSEFWNLLEEYQVSENLRPSLSIKRGVEDYVKSKVFMREEALDSQNHLINLQNGVYNLLDGNLYPHNPDYRFTTILPFDYDPAAQTNIWTMYALSTFVKPRSREHDPDLLDFVQEAIGYSLTTSVAHHVTFWCYGEGANGKGVLFHVLEQLGGTAVMPLNIGLLKREQYQLAMLAGKRIALCSEASATDNLVEDAIVKALVGGDTISVRQIRQEPFSLYPTAKLWWAMNELPVVADTSEGFWRRVRVIPFNRTFGDKEKILDLKEKLDLELSGIFNWAMAGLRRLHSRGKFVEPNQVQVATAKYREESNPIKLFVDDTCVVRADLQVQSKVIYNAYSEWCQDNGFRRQSIKNFKGEMERLEFYAKRLNTGTHYTGLDLNQATVWP